MKAGEHLENTKNSKSPPGSLIRILHLEDDAYDSELVASMLKSEGIDCVITRVESQDDFITTLEEGKFDIIFADYALPSFDGFSALEIVKEKYAYLPFILITGALGEDVAVEILKGGATDYILKSNLSRLSSAVSRALSEVEERRERERMEQELRLLFSAVMQSSEGIAITDLEGELLFSNRAFASMHGYTVEEMSGKNISEFHCSEQMPSVKSVQKEVLEAGDFSGEVWCSRRDGTVFPSLMHSTLMKDEEGVPRGIIYALQDITEQKKNR